MSCSEQRAMAALKSKTFTETATNARIAGKLQKHADTTFSNTGSCLELKRLRNRNHVPKSNCLSMTVSAV